MAWRLSARSPIRGAARVSVPARRRSEREIGWLLPFHGATSIEEGNVYSMGWCVLDLKKPEKVLYVSDAPALTPEAPYEIEHDAIPQVDMANFKTGVRVVFPQGLVERGDDLIVYYGAADVSIAGARVNKKELLAFARGSHRAKEGRCSSVIPGRSALVALIVLCVACGRKTGSSAVPKGEAPLGLRLDHLQHLGLSAVVKGQPVRVVSLYAEAPGLPSHTASPARDGFEGIASLDDAARAAVVYLREYEATGDVRARDEAVRLLAFVTAMEQGDGEFVNFIDSAGRLNLKAPSSRKSMSYWAARSIWALGEAERVLGPSDSTAADADAPGAPSRRRPDGARDRSRPFDWRVDDGHGGGVARAARNANGEEQSGGNLPRDAHGRPVGPALGRYRHCRALGGVRGQSRRSLACMGSAINRGAGDRSTQYGAHESLGGRGKGGERTMGSLPAGWADSSGRCADGTATWYPQIAYGIGPIVEGYLALADLTGQRRYAVFAGLAASWFLGDNPAGITMYDERSGRTFDGLDGPSPEKLNRNSGAESTIEALLALQRVNSNPDAAAVPPLSARWRAFDFAGERARSARVRGPGWCAHHSAPRQVGDRDRRAQRQPHRSR